MSSATPSATPAVPTGTLGRAVTVFRLAAGFTFLAVAMGAVVCATNSGAGCPTWPGCQVGTIAPQWQLGPVVEFTHRVVAIGAGPLILAAAVLSLRLPGADRWVRVLPWVALAGAVAAGAFGRLVVLSGVPTWAGAVDLSAALTAMTVMGIAAVRLGSTVRPQSIASRQMSSPAGELVPVSRHRALQPVQLAGAAVVVLIVMQVAGLFVAGPGSFTRCMGWPLWQQVTGDAHPWLQAVRLGLAALAAAAVIGTALLCGRHERLRPWGLGLGGLLVAELVMGLVIGAGGSGAGLQTAYSVVAVTLLWGLGLFTAVARAQRLVPARPAREAATV